MPHLLIITKNYPPIVCGVGDHSYVLKQQLEQRGWQVSILTLQQQQWGLLQTNLQSFTPFHQHLGAALKAAVKLLGTPPVILWQYAPLSFSSKGTPVNLAWQVFLLRLQGFRQAIYFHEVAVRTVGYGFSQMVHSLLQKIIANKMNLFVQHSATSIALYQTYFLFKPLTLIPVGSNLPVANATLALEPAGARHFFCFTNRCTPALLEALVQYTTYSKQNVQLHIAGAANAEALMQLKQHLKYKGAEPLVQLHGVLSNQALANLLSSCDIVLQPQPLQPNGQGGVSAKNGTIAAAMQAGKPIITIAGDMTEARYFKHGETCWLISKDEPAQWLQSITFLEADKNLQTKLAEGSVHCFHRYFSAASTVPAIEKLLTAP